MKRFPKKSNFQPSKMRQIVFFQAQIYIKKFWIASKALRNKRIAHMQFQNKQQYLQPLRNTRSLSNTFAVVPVWCGNPKPPSRLGVLQMPPE